MPIYEYFCSQCQLKFELIRPMARAGEDALCPGCQRPARRAVSRFASFSKNEAGVTAPIAGTAPSCASCSMTSCSSCG